MIAIAVVATAVVKCNYCVVLLVLPALSVCLSVVVAVVVVVVVVVVVFVDAQHCLIFFCPCIAISAAVNE